MSSSAILRAALAYVVTGRRVLALNGKRPWPALIDWPHRATLDSDEVLRWWARWPGSNVGLLCGHGWLVLDVDGEGARRALAELEAAHGALPATATVASGRDGYGRHLHFRAPPDARSWVPWDDGDSRLEVKARGSQVVAPPSIHPGTGRAYVWLDERPCAWAPAWLLRRPAPARTAAAADHLDPLRRVPADVYVPLLTRRNIERGGYVSCPLHEGDNDPSLKVYGGDSGWFCFGCRRGGTIIDLAAALWGLDTRGEDYKTVRRRLIDLLLGVSR